MVHERTREQREEEEKPVTALSKSARLSTLRYRCGLDSYLQVLDAEGTYFGASSLSPNCDYKNSNRQCNYFAR